MDPAELHQKQNNELIQKNLSSDSSQYKEIKDNLTKSPPNHSNAFIRQEDSLVF